MQDDLVERLRSAAPGLRVAAGRDPWHSEHAVADFPDAEAVQLAYLFNLESEIALALYPADTLTQARVFYKDDARVKNTLELGMGGWAVRPNFHWGFREKGLCWTTSRLDLRDYTDYWRARISTLAEIERDEWERELQRLVRDGVFDPADLDEFARHFTDTARKKASPRPGLSVSCAWSLEQALDPEFPSLLRGGLRTALAAFGEHRILWALQEK
jgi:hypothetical protein